MVWQNGDKVWQIVPINLLNLFYLIIPSKYNIAIIPTIQPGGNVNKNIKKLITIKNKSIILIKNI